tara:strand:+ start:66 stop:239 length:174 start_codon:yes stop_codon:yes gene_type:complete
VVEVLVMILLVVEVQEVLEILVVFQFVVILLIQRLSEVVVQADQVVMKVAMVLYQKL